MMSNNLVPQQLSMHGVETGQLEQFPNKVDSSMQIGLMKPGTNDPAQQFSVPNNLMGPASGGLLSQQMSIANNQAQLLQPMPNGNLLQRLPMPNTGHMELHAHNMVPTQLMMPNRQSGEMELMFNSAGTQQILTPNKRKSPMEPTSNSSLSQKLLSNKQAAHMEHRPWLQQTSAPQKLPAQMQPVSSSSSAQRLQAPSKRSNPSKSGPQQLPFQKKQTVQFQPSPKGQSESNDSMRSKLRQSLADALALVSQQENKPSSAENNSLGEASSSQGQVQGNPHALGSTSGTADTIDHNIETLKESMAIKEESLAPKFYDGQNSGQESSSIFRDEDASFSDSFFVKDELLQGNGLSWVMEADAVMGERNDIEATQKKQDEVSGTGAQTAEDPKILATKIEAELFKYFGGVNKKYKEKGRSLLFNLKDRSNPELRERVMSGEIPPERLCSMTAEELASKELSEWRMAKAEELAQMVVLPDDVDVRRLVKKTHKGEFQVEVEHQDSVSVDVAVAPSSVTQAPSKSKQREASPPSKSRQTDKKSLKSNQMEEKLDSNGDKKNLGDKEIDCTITIPSSEGADLMQGLMVDDELKDVDFLPPIVSLDEFMESLDSEPPFEGLPVDAAGKTTPVSDKDDTEVASDSKSPNKTMSSPVDTTAEKPDNIGATDTKLDADGNSPDSHGKPEVTQASTAPKGELVWEGLLQLNISSTASVIGIYKSGEKATAKEWLGSVEIKGRVRLDAFEKFLQELPMSRSRSVMAIHLFCKEGSSESERASLNEVADSYVADGRVGFAQPSPGVELYLCPPHSKSRDMLVKVLPKDQIDALNAIDNGLVGVIIWRKAHVISPNSASHHKHNSKKHPTSRKPSHEKQTSTNESPNVNVTPRHPQLPRSAGPQLDDDEDDVPPGFGPPGARDEDDLPEFNFSSGGGGDMMLRSRLSHQSPRVAPINQPPQALARPSEQMRELVHRYGQSDISAPAPPLNRGYGVAVQPWDDDDDDDDDMPEWRPESNAPLQNLQPQSAHLLGQQPNLRAQMVQQPMKVNAFHGQQNVASWQQQQQQGAWVVPPGSNGHPVYQTNGGQAYGGPAPQQAAWSRDATRSRGF